MTTTPRKIMLVDDNIISMMVTDEVLTSHGYRVSKTTSPNGCIAKIEYEEPDLLLIDVEMARLAVDDLFSSLVNNKEHPDLVVVIFSNMEPGELQDLCQTKDAHGYFSKSMDVTRLPEFIDYFF